IPEVSRALLRTVPPGSGLDAVPAGSDTDARDRPDGVGSSGNGAADWTEFAANRLDARVVEPITGPRPPALQARGPRLDPAVALARLADAAAGPGRAGPGARGARRRHACGAGPRAVLRLGDLHPGCGVAWAGAASRLGSA